MHAISYCSVNILTTSNSIRVFHLDIRRKSFFAYKLTPWHNTELIDANSDKLMRFDIDFHINVICMCMHLLSFPWPGVIAFLLRSPRTPLLIPIHQWHWWLNTIVQSVWGVVKIACVHLSVAKTIQQWLLFSIAWHCELCLNSSWV